MVPADVPGAKELAITSDDLFSLKEDPGKTLVVGASYIALECAGLLTELGYDVTIAVRSILLRGFDQECANRLGNSLLEAGTKFIREVVPKRMEKKGDMIEVTLSNGHVDTYKTVLYAVGRAPDTVGLNLSAVGVTLSDKGKFICKKKKKKKKKKKYSALI
eukprot:Trichotokara_eunicae@DN3366_c0_g1_i1.p1